MKVESGGCSGIWSDAASGAAALGGALLSYPWSPLWKIPVLYNRGWYLASCLKGWTLTKKSNVSCFCPLFYPSISPQNLKPKVIRVKNLACVHARLLGSRGWWMPYISFWFILVTGISFGVWEIEIWRDLDFRPNFLLFFAFVYYIFQDNFTARNKALLTQWYAYYNLPIFQIYEWFSKVDHIQASFKWPSIAVSCCNDQKGEMKKVSPGHSSVSQC